MPRISETCLEETHPTEAILSPSKNSRDGHSEEGTQHQQQQHLLSCWEWLHRLKVNCPGHSDARNSDKASCMSRIKASILYILLSGHFEFGSYRRCWPNKKKAGSQGGGVSTGSSAPTKGPTTLVVVRVKRWITNGVTGCVPRRTTWAGFTINLETFSNRSDQRGLCIR